VIEATSETERQLDGLARASFERVCRERHDCRCRRAHNAARGMRRCEGGRQPPLCGATPASTCPKHEGAPPRPPASRRPSAAHSPHPRPASPQPLWRRKRSARRCSAFFTTRAPACALLALVQLKLRLHAHDSHRVTQLLIIIRPVIPQVHALKQLPSGALHLPLVLRVARRRAQRRGVVRAAVRRGRRAAQASCGLVARTASIELPADQGSGEPASAFQAGRGRHSPQLAYPPTSAAIAARPLAIARGP
jgi:hypothetical protein